MPNPPEFWRLDSESATLVVVHDQAVPRLLWFGDSLAPDLDINSFLALDNSAVPYGTRDQFTPMSFFPQASEAYTASPGLSGHRAGAQFAHALTTRKISSVENGLLIELQDDDAGLAIELNIHLHPSSNVASIQTTLSNIADSPYTVDWLAAGSLPVPSHFSEADITNLHGRTSHEQAPSLVLGEQAFNEDRGDVLFCHLAWSGNFSLKVEKLSTNDISLQAGIHYLPGECILQAGQSVSTPKLHFTRAGGMNACTQNFHTFCREAVLPKWTRTPRPVHANSWEALYFNHDQSALFSLIDAAASIGAERFVLDDGWFLHRRSDNAGLGDWFVDKTVYPEGLHPVVNHVRQNNMQFGLWFEPEMVNPDSDLYRAHPEWALHVNHIDTPLARNQLVLDIDNEAVSQYLFDCITTLVEEYAIDYIKWDQNRDLVLAGDGQHAKAASQPRALYRLLERISNKCPNLEIETCASGGARTDFAVLKHTGRVWTSDNIDPIERASIQQGFLRFLPPEIMGAHVGHKAAHLTGRETSLHTRAIVALQGQLGFELDARKLDEHEISTLQHYTQYYKNNRDWLAESRFWQIPTHTNEIVATGNVNLAQSQAIFHIIVTQNLKASRPGSLTLRGLDPTARYEVSLDSINLEDLRPFNKVMPLWCEQNIVTDGFLLLKTGLPLPVMPPQSALLVGCKKVEKT